MIQAVLFDMGGTLHTCSDSPARRIWFAQRLLERLRDYGIDLDLTPQALSAQLAVNAEIYKHETEASLQELPTEVIWNDYYLRQQRIGRERLAPISEELSFLYDYERVRNLRRPGLTECMRALKDMGLRLGVISNIISKSIVPHFLAEYGLSEMMECVVTSAQTGVRKPSAEIFRIAQRRMNLSPDELAYVGDTLSRDVRGTRNAGWGLMIQIENPASAHRDAGLENSGLKPDYRIRELAQIPPILAQIRNTGA